MLEKSLALLWHADRLADPNWLAKLDAHGNHKPGEVLLSVRCPTQGGQTNVTLQTYNLCVTFSTSFRRASLGLISLLMGLLALGPFLHAHYGASWATGFHLSGLPAVMASALPDVATDSPMLSLPSEEESPAVGVVTSLPRGEVNSFTPDAPALLLLSVCVLQVLQRLPLPGLWTPVAAPLRAPLSQAGWPPPAQAPPHAS